MITTISHQFRLDRRRSSSRRRRRTGLDLRRIRPSNTRIECGGARRCGRGRLQTLRAVQRFLVVQLYLNARVTAVAFVTSMMFRFATLFAGSPYEWSKAVSGWVIRGGCVDRSVCGCGRWNGFNCILVAIRSVVGWVTVLTSGLVGVCRWWGRWFTALQMRECIP